MVKKPVILIADDDDRLLSALSIRLSSEFAVVEATDGRCVLELVQLHQPDLMILDVDMPGCDGFSLIEAMDQMAGLNTIPVIYISGAIEGEGLRQSGERLGAVATISKPIEAGELIRCVRLILPGQACTA